MDAFDATVTRPVPVSAQAELWVQVAGFDDGRSAIGPCRWQGNPAALPAEGDRCLLIQTTPERTPWVVLFDGRDVPLP